MIEYYGNPNEPSGKLYKNADGKWVRNDQGSFTLVETTGRMVTGTKMALDVRTLTKDK